MRENVGGGLALARPTSLRMPGPRTSPVQAAPRGWRAQSHAPICPRLRAVLSGPSGLRKPAHQGNGTSPAGMKPPQRRRAAPSRYLGEVTGPAAWSAREKRQLLRLLQARRGQPEPDATELARELPGRSEAEVNGSREGSEAGGGAVGGGAYGWAGRGAAGGETEGRGEGEAAPRGGWTIFGGRLGGGGACVRLGAERVPSPKEWRPETREGAAGAGVKRDSSEMQDGAGR